MSKTNFFAGRSPKRSAQLHCGGMAEFGLLCDQNRIPSEHQKSLPLPGSLLNPGFPSFIPTSGSAEYLA